MLENAYQKYQFLSPVKQQTNADLFHDDYGSYDRNKL